MKQIIPILIVALLFCIDYAPCAAQEGVPLKGREIDRSKLKLGEFVEVVYYSKKGKETKAEGYIKAVKDSVFTIGRGLWKERVNHRDVISLGLAGDTRLRRGPRVVKDRKDREFWINAGAGGCSVGISSGLSCSYLQAGKHLMSARFVYSKQFDILWGDEPEEKALEIGVLYGRAFQGRFGLASLSAGLGVVTGVRHGAFLRHVGSGGWIFSSSSYDIYEERTLRTIGIPVDAQLLLVPHPFLGIGLHGFANLNSERSYYGVLLCLSFGKERKR